MLFWQCWYDLDTVQIGITIDIFFPLLRKTKAIDSIGHLIFFSPDALFLSFLSTLSPFLKLAIFFSFFPCNFITILSVWCLQVELEFFINEYANALLECNVVEERAKILAYDLIGFEEKVKILWYVEFISLIFPIFLYYHSRRKNNYLLWLLKEGLLLQKVL